MTAFFNTPIFDTHAHLDQDEFRADLAEVIARARGAGVGDILCVGTTLASSRSAASIAVDCGLWAAVGIHPNCCREAGSEDWTAIEQLATAPRVVAIGETGLDRHWDYAPLALQREWFARHIELAQRAGLPLVIHCRDAQEEVLEVIASCADRSLFRGVMHSFSGDGAFAAACVGLGLHISFSGSATYKNKKFAPLHEAVRQTPADRLLVETDSPYLSPEPLRGRQSRNEPACIVHIVERVAALRGVESEEIAAITTKNARRLFLADRHDGALQVDAPL